MDCHKEGKCGSCCGGCSCSHELVLTQDELMLLTRLAEIPFLPLARRSDSTMPVYLEDGCKPNRYSAALLGLEQKRLVTLDYHMPLTNFDYGAYAGYNLRGSFALTLAGQEALESLEIQGIGGEFEC